MKAQNETAASMSQIIGKTGKFHHATLEFAIEIHDVRQNFGRTDYYITPVHGKGELWVSADRVSID